MYAPAAARARFATDNISTASPSRLLVMLYDRLDLDLLRGEKAIRDGDRLRANTELLHAQDIVSELLSSLDVEAWSGGPGLAALYTWVLTELVGANMGSDADRVATVRETLTPLREAWHQAAAEVGAPAAASYDAAAPARSYSPTDLAG